MTVDEAKAAVKKYGTKAQAARALGIPRQTFCDRLRGIVGVDTKPATTTDARRAGRSLADFRATYDKATIIPAKVRAALKALGSGWEYEVQFAKLAGVSLADLGTFRDGFAEHVVSLREGRRAWAGTAATAKAMREML